MEETYCMNCLQEIPAYPCPLCGYDPAGTPQVAQALEQCILRGRYLTGRVLEKNGFEIIYKGKDLAENAPVTIWEFFPAGEASRQADGRVHRAAPPVQGQDTMLSRIRQRLPQDAVLDSFSENGTVYIVCKPCSQSPRPVCAPPVKRESEFLPFLLALLAITLTAIALIPWIMELL